MTMTPATKSRWPKTIRQLAVVVAVQERRVDHVREERCLGVYQLSFLRVQSFQILSVSLSLSAPASSPSRSSDTVRLSPERLAEHRLRVQMRQRIERERRQRLCERVTAAQARSTIEQSLARLPYQPALVKPLVATHDDTSDVAERSAFHDIPSTTACPKSTARPRVPIASIIRRRKSSEAPVANTSATPRSASSSFGDFCLVPPRYHKDFLLS